MSSKKLFRSPLRGSKANNFAIASWNFEEKSITFTWPCHFACNSLPWEQTFSWNTHASPNLVLLVLCHQFITDHAPYRSLGMDVLQNSSSSLNNFIGDTCEQPNMRIIFIWTVMMSGFFIRALSPGTVHSWRKLRRMALERYHVKFLAYNGN